MNFFFFDGQESKRSWGLDPCRLVRHGSSPQLRLPAKKKKRRARLVSDGIRKRHVLPGNGASTMAAGQMNSLVQHLRRVALVHDSGERTDGQLLECFVGRRDETAFEALVRRHGPMVLGVCRRLLGNAHDAEDAFQATFLVLVRKAATLRQRELVGNWLYGTAYRAALETKAASAAHRAKERQVREMPEPEALVETDGWQDLRPLLDQELNRLPERDRVPVVLCDLEGRKRKEVARQLHIPEGTLSSRLAKARKMLARRLARHHLALSGGALALALSQSAASACVPSALVVTTVQAATLLAAGSAAGGP